MLAKLAYLVSAKLKPHMQGDLTPIPEYQVYIEQDGTTLLDFNFMESQGSYLAKTFHSRGKSHFGLALAAAESKDYDGYLVSGEDAGLPLILFTRMRMSRKPIHIITHGSYFRSSKFQFFLNRFKSDHNIHYLCLSESLRNTMVQKFGIRPEQAHNPSYGVDTEFFKPKLSSSPTPIIASAGTASRDYKTLVKAAEGLQADLKIAADSAWFPTALDIDKDSLPKNVEARSYGDYAGLRDLYADSSFVVVPLYPAIHACGYAVIIEAMAMGRTVIATRTQNPSDFIIEGENGFYVEPGDAEGLRERMTQLLCDPELAKAMGENARKRIETHFTNEAYCAKMRAVVEQAKRY